MSSKERHLSSGNFPLCKNTPGRTSGLWMLFLGMPVGREGCLSQGHSPSTQRPARAFVQSLLPPKAQADQKHRIPPSPPPGQVEELEGEQAPSSSVSILRSKITRHHILKVMLTFLSREAKPKTTQAQLVLALVQIQGLSQ